MSAIAAVGGLGMGIANSVKSGQAAKDARKEIDSQRDLIDRQEATQRDWFNKQYYTDLTERSEVLQALRLLDERDEKERKRSAAQAAITVRRRRLSWLRRIAGTRAGRTIWLR